MDMKIIILMVVCFAAGFLISSVGDYWRWTIRVAEFYSQRPEYVSTRNPERLLILADEIRKSRGVDQ